MLQIGTVSVVSRCMLAPMAGVSDLPFRMVARRFGCELAFTEMISARSLVCQSRNTEKMLATDPTDGPLLGIQLLGDDPLILQKALDKLRSYPFDIIDFNAACPVTKVTGRGEGASLMKEPRKLHRLLKALVQHAGVPVMVKIRAGWDENSRNARVVAQYAQDAGVQGLIIHGRTRQQGYRGTVDYRIIQEVKDILSIPVIGSGDALSPYLIKKMFDETGCDGVAIARGALGNPWIFRETFQFLVHGNLPNRPGLDDVADTMCMHLDLCIDRYGEMTGTVLFRKFFAWYTKGIFGMKKIREKAFQAKTRNEMLDVISILRLPDHAWRVSSYESTSPC